MKNTIKTLLFSIFSIIILVGCNKSKKEKIIIGYLPIIAHLPLEIAKEAGLLNELNIEYKVYGTSEDLIYDLRDGKIQMATTIAISPLMRIIQEDKGTNSKIKIFSYSSTGQNSPFDGVFVDKDSEIKSLSDLKGKKIGVFPGTTAKNIMTLLLERDYNISRNDVEFIMLPPPAQIQAIESGNIDALFTYETVRSKCLLAGLKPIHGSVVASVLENAPYGCSAINSNFLDENPKIAHKIIKAFDDGYLSLENDPVNARNILNSNLGVSKSVAEKCNLEKRIISSELSLDKNYLTFKSFIEILNNSGDLKSSIIKDDLMYD